jgi:16S rRNA (guanine527-N7)-methyltransferase
VTGKTETPPERHFLLSTTSPAAASDAAATRAALERLLTDAPAVADSLPAGFLSAVQAFVGQLLDANRATNLTRVTLPQEVARLHLLDSLAALPLIDGLAPAEVIDLGSGGGLPALPLALARPEMRWTLVDSVRKKAAILREFTEVLGMRNVTILPERAETLGRDDAHRERYDLVTARACAPLPVLAELALPLLAVGGSLVAWKGPLRESDEELRRGRFALDELGAGPARLVETGLAVLGGRGFVVAVKVRSTPSRFPRRPGEPARRPLG